jgi:FHA domain
MIQPEVTLILYDEQGRAREVCVQGRRFSIGRGADNDLALDDAGLSRRHALLEIFDGVVQVSDCGSQNGTFVNGKPVSGAAALKDGDMISIGAACDMTVRISRPVPAPASGSPKEAQGFAFDEYLRKGSAESAAAPRPRRWLPTVELSPVVLWGIATAVILLGAGAIIFVLKSDDHNGGQIQSRDAGDSARVPDPAIPSASPRPPVDQGLKRIEAAAREVIRESSNDEVLYVFPDEEPLKQVKQRLEQHRASPAMASALSAIKQLGQSIVTQAERKRIKPALVFYVALAETGWGRGDVLAAAQRMLDDLVLLQATFGDDANSSLIVVAAYKGGGMSGRAALLQKMRQKIKNPVTDRNVWFLRKAGLINDETYQFIFDFLAIGVIAQHPAEFGVSAAALKF